MLIRTVPIWSQRHRQASTCPFCSVHCLKLLGNLSSFSRLLSLEASLLLPTGSAVLAHHTPRCFQRDSVPLRLLFALLYSTLSWPPWVDAASNRRHTRQSSRLLAFPLRPPRFLTSLSLQIALLECYRPFPLSPTCFPHSLPHLSSPQTSTFACQCHSASSQIHHWDLVGRSDGWKELPVGSCWAGMNECGCWRPQAMISLVTPAAQDLLFHWLCQTWTQPCCPPSSCEPPRFDRGGRPRRRTPVTPDTPPVSW